MGPGSKWACLLAVALWGCGGGKPAQEPFDAGVFPPSGGGDGGTGGGMSKRTLTLAGDPRMTNPRFSHDGARIAFVHTQGSVDSVALLNADGTNLVLVNGGASYLTGFDWSDDGARLIYSGSVIYQLPSGGGDPTELVGGFDAFASYDPDLSADGTRLVYAVNGSTLKLVDLTQQPPAVTSLAVRGNSPRFSPDGQRILYADKETNTIRLLDAAGGNPQDVVASDGFFASADWLSDGQRIVATTDVGLEMITLGTHPLQRRKLLDGTAIMSVDVSPDDKKLVYSINGQRPLFLLINF